MIKAFLPIAALLICVWPTGVSADSRSSQAPGEHSQQKAPVSQPSGSPTPRSGAKAFIHPETGEILTHEQWHALSLENDEVEAIPRSSSDAPEPENTRTVPHGRQIDLGNGKYVILVDVPESDMVETKAWFDEKGRAHITCNH